VHQTKPREIAVNVLLKREEKSAFTEDLLNELLKKQPLKPQDRRLVHELVLGIVRWQDTLDWLVARKTSGRQQTPTLQILLRLGLYQMFWLDRIPGYAAVNESVDLARRMGLASQSGFVNAVLRSYGREREATQILLDKTKQERPGLGFSHPEWLYHRWQSLWGLEATSQLMAWNNGPASTFARINTLRASTADLLQAWDQEKVKSLARTWDWTGRDLVFELLEHPSLESLPSLQQGWFYIQDPSTLLAPTLLNAQPGERILDACAAPGGKTTLIAQCMQNQGRIVAEDIHAERLNRVAENCRRLGVTCVDAQLIPDDSNPPLPPTQTQTLFDRILVDVPCSNTGVMRRRVDLRWRLKPEELDRLSQLQLKILRRAAPRLKPGGILVYSTCSLEPEENQAVVKQLMDENPAFQLEQERQLRPFADQVDGAYAARLRRTG
jgi:16S rRNA (cytosine967-C5)-methyltransferase